MQRDRQGTVRVAQMPDGWCVYRSESGCGIYSRRPRLCRKADCRALYLRLDKLGRDLRVAQDPHYASIFEAAARRLPVSIPRRKGEHDRADG
jgi:hypothetical protein